MFTRVVVNRTAISVVQNREPDAGENRFDVVVDGRLCATVELGRYYPPSIGVYEDQRVAVWAGNRLAFTAEHVNQWEFVEFGEPVHAVYRVASGWCVVAELTVFTVNERGAVVSEFGHREVIISSRWANRSLVLEDFDANVLAVTIDDALTITAADVPMRLEPT